MGLATAAFALASQAADFATSTAGHDHLPGGWVDYVISGAWHMVTGSMLRMHGISNYAASS